MGRKPLLQLEAVLDTIQGWIVRNGIAPTIEELRRVLKVGSTRTVLRYLEQLEEEGEIERWPGSRGIRLLRTPKRGLETVLVPIVGTAPAGPLMLADQNTEGWVRLPRRTARSHGARLFLLRVRGNSMNRARIDGDRIESGDLVLVRQQSVADPNAIVVALIDGEVTIKRLMRRAGHWLLAPESSEKTHQPIILRTAFHVQGVVIGVLKQGAALASLFGDIKQTT